ncbi:(2Fe-2S)-binding protein [Pleionea sediminis]|uniref:(2Fe-2S)-binding protein n=1 Tax=Pleionea sediminis TaxID=2569479 RepID=UPI0011861F0B|nr:(2Fe-2S)-binding protein [Pleionea sediminis]
MYVCLCRGITDTQIKQAVNEGKASCMKSLSKALGIAGDCGRCGRVAKELLEQSILPDVKFTSAA